jgi:hypothetical protein
MWQRLFRAGAAMRSLPRRLQLLPPLILVAGLVVAVPFSPADAVGPVDESEQGDSTSVITVGGVAFVVHEFTTPGTTAFKPPVAVSGVDYLVVGGGGGGGARYGGGGGGGGVLHGNLAVTGGQEIAVTVGAGGAGGVARASGVTQGPGADGSASSLGALVAAGGGGGGPGINAAANEAGRAGASGGGGGGVTSARLAAAAGGAGTAGQAGGAGTRSTATYYGSLDPRNYPDLVAGGGGGFSGAGGAGATSSSSGALRGYAGAGGAGATSSITGTSLGYAGGGGGGAFKGGPGNQAGDGRDGGGNGTNEDATPTKAVRGGGGGGGGLSVEGGNGSAGGGGGDGVVIVRYPVSSTTTQVTVSTSSVLAGETVTFTATSNRTDATGVVTFTAGGTELGTCTMTRTAPGTTGTCHLDVDDLPVGTYAVTATYAGSAAYTGSSSSSTADVRIRAAGLTVAGFDRPVEMGDEMGEVINTVKAGATVPLKFVIHLDGVPTGDLDLIDGFTVTRVACAGLSGTYDPVDFTTTGNTVLRFDAVAEQFVQNWKVPSTRNACYLTEVRINGEETITASFQTR